MHLVINYSHYLGFELKIHSFSYPVNYPVFKEVSGFVKCKNLLITSYIHNLLSYRGWEKHGSTRETGNVSGVSRDFHYHCFVWETSRPLGCLMTNKHEVVNRLIAVSSKYDWVLDVALARSDSLVGFQPCSFVPTRFPWAKNAMSLAIFRSFSRYLRGSFTRFNSPNPTWNVIDNYWNLSTLIQQSCSVVS